MSIIVGKRAHDDIETSDIEDGMYYIVYFKICHSVNPPRPFVTFLSFLIYRLDSLIFSP